jgi:uncharacterized protein (TIGR03066 family)
LAANREQQPAFFTYSEKQSRLELVLSMTNAEISPRVLREEIRRLAQIAENTANLWEISNQSSPQAPPGKQVATSVPQATNSAPQRTAQAQPRTTAPAAAGSILGKWSASRSDKEAFAMQLNADGSFVLVFVNNGKQSRSTGKYTHTGGQLTLTTEGGGKFAGGVANLTATSFEFVPTGKASKLTFQKAS